MDLPRAFPDFDAGRVVFRDEALLVVDKPAGVPSQASDPEVHDDLPSRLRSLAPYLGTHQRLDAETSGLVLFTTDRAANPSIAAQFEQRLVKKTYLACVSGWPRRDAKRTLRHVLDGKPAVTHVKLLETRADRSLLELDLETGRTHQARVQLAKVGAPIAGDTLYDGAPAPRLMLHAAGLRLTTPSGRKLSLSAPVPTAMRKWLETGQRTGELREALSLAFERRWGLLRAMPSARATDVFRLADEEGDALPGVTVDFYAGWAVVAFSGDPDERVLDAVASFGFDGVYEKSRPKHGSVGVEERAPASPSRGATASAPLGVMEEGVPFLVRLDAGLATGFYADQRRNRLRVRSAAKGGRVLNLFSYTCAFSVVAARGGATRTVSVDASASVLERGRENFVHAGLDPAGHDFVAMDARAYLERAVRKGERFDLVVLDPPSFGRAKGARFAVQADFGAVCELAFGALSDRGEILASINHQKTTQDRFRHAVQDAARAAGKNVKVRDLPVPLDYPSGHLKAVWGITSR